MSLRTKLNRLAIAARVAAATPEIVGLTRNKERERSTLPGLRSPVEVLRDRWGVPHLYAEHEEDVFQAQGYLHARERLWQMELQRRLALGEMAAALGADALDSDRLVRILGLNRAAEREAERLSPHTAAVVDAYVRGVNALLAEEGRRPLEMRALRVHPRPWERRDVLAWGLMMGLILSGNWASELLRAQVIAAVGRETAIRLGVAPPGLSDEETYSAGEAAGKRTTVPALGDLLQHGPDAARGSNAWVAGPERSTSGAPLLACDPHLNLQAPSLWFENHLEAGDLRVSGVSLPGSPGVVIGHNQHVAWGVTNARVNVQDVYLERVANGNYLCEDGWRPLGRRHEEIRVRGRRHPHVEEVTASRHGPVVTALSPDSLLPGRHRGPEGEELPDGETLELALQWVGTGPGALVDAVLALGRAEDWESFRRALAGWTCPAQNFLYADVAGNIGYALAGTVPLRSGGEGRLPVPGWTGAHKWTGVVPAEDMPSVLNPENGYLVSANNGVLATGGAPIHGEWLAPYRADRITQLLTARPEHDVASFVRIQQDLVSLPGLDVAALAPRLPSENEVERSARELLARWDGRLDADSGAGAVYWVLRSHLLKAAFVELSEPLGFRAGIGAFSWQPGLEFLEQQALPTLLRDLLRGDLGPNGPKRERGDELLATAWRAALGELCDWWGEDTSTWRYGRKHRLELRHSLGGVPLLGRRLNPVSAAVGGDMDTVCPGQLVTKSDGSQGFGGASYRQVYDLSDWDRGRAIHLPGQSGRPGDQHYDDFVSDWLEGRPHPTPWSRERVEEALEHKEELVPVDS